VEVLAEADGLTPAAPRSDPALRGSSCTFAEKGPASRVQASALTYGSADRYQTNAMAHTTMPTTIPVTPTVTTNQTT
jgi:hypothetical protein